MTELEFSHLLTIYRASQFAADGKSATVQVMDEAVLYALHLALENVDDSGITTDDDADKIAVGDAVRVHIRLPKISLGYLASNFGSLLAMRRAAFAEPKNYFLITERYEKGGENPPIAVTRYQKVLALIGLLRKCAAYLDKDRGELVFIKGGKYSIPVNYSPGELAGVDLVAIDKILGFFNVKDDAHEDQKLAILAEAMMGMLDGVAAGRRFITLLLELQQLSEKFADGYKLYLANFSYDKVRDELQAWKVEYTGKIHKVFGDIQNQLLSIPVATVIVATQLKLVGKKEFAIFLANVAVVIGCWIFALLFMMLCRNQYRTLQVLEGEVDRQEKKMKSDYESVLEMFEEVFTSLRGRVKDQKRALVGVVFILIIGLAVAHYFWWQLTKGYFQP
jgi:hypothetical protein